MTTDNHPVDYLYLSRRLLASVAEQDSAHRKGVRKHVGGLSVGPISVEFKGQGGAGGSPFSLVEACTRAVSDHTRTLATPGHDYIRDTLVLLPTLLRFQQTGRTRTSSTQIAWLTAKAKKRLVVLVGSRENYVNWASPGISEPALETGWSPSSPEGLRQIVEDASKDLAGAAEPVARMAEASISCQILDGEDEEDLLSTVVAIDDAHRRGTTPIRPPQSFEFLARILIEPGEVRSPSGRLVFNEVVVAAPLWVRTAPPASLLESFNTRRRSRQTGDQRR